MYWTLPVLIVLEPPQSYIIRPSPTVIHILTSLSNPLDIYLTLPTVPLSHNPHTYNQGYNESKTIYRLQHENTCIATARLQIESWSLTRHTWCFFLGFLGLTMYMLVRGIPADRYTLISLELPYAAYTFILHCRRGRCR